MSKMELLAPAGDFESLKMAVYYGADAVYLGVKQFNARNNIDGFSLETLPQAVDFAHLYGVKVYLALNILIKDEEMQDALDLIYEANNIGVDAVIVQDLGLAGLVKKYYPSIELHASTQMAVHNLEGVKVLEKLGFKRVVLARETPLAEIERIHKNSDIEREFFVQGALCVSFSGNCYMCSHLVGKSGNRGVCKQFCRLPYTFKCGTKQNKGYLLSAKDINMLDKLNELKTAGVISLKIEGRARRPFYVAQACNVYRKALDGKVVTYKDLNGLKLAFNRQYTPAYFNGNGDIISKLRGNNGLEIGEVVDVKYGNKFNEVFIKTNYNLKSQSGLKFLYKGEEIASIGAYDVKRIKNLYCVTTTSKIKVGSKVNIIQDSELECQLLSYIKKLRVDIKFVANENQPLCLTAKYQDVIVTVEGDIAQKAKTIETSIDKIKEQLSRSELFEINDCYIETNNCYILNSSINHLRNELYKKLQEKILKKYNNLNNKLNKINLNNEEMLLNTVFNDKNVKKFNFKIINNINNLNTIDCNKYENLIYDYDNFEINNFILFDKFCKDNNCNGYIDLPNFAIKVDIDKIKEALVQTDLGVVANNLYALSFDANMIGGQFLNIYNRYTIEVLKSLHKFKALFVEELQDYEVEDLKSDLPLIRREKVYMTLLHCPFKQNVGGDCCNCKYANAQFAINSGKVFNIKRKKTAGCVFLLKD